MPDGKKKGMAAEFKAFVMRGNVIDMAVGIIVGGLFTSIVQSFVKDIFNPILGFLIGGVDFTQLKWVLKEATETTEEVAVRYGNLIQNIMQFILTAFVLFLIIKAINRLSGLVKREDKECAES